MGYILIFIFGAHLLSLLKTAHGSELLGNLDITHGVLSSKATPLFMRGNVISQACLNTPLSHFLYARLQENMLAGKLRVLYIMNEDFLSVIQRII